MNKLNIILLSFFLILFENSLAQKLELELLLRPTLTSLRGNQIVKDIYGPTINFSTGVNVQYLLKKNSFVSLCILYEKKGGRDETHIVLNDAQNQPYADGTVLFESNFDYITIPIQCGKKFGDKIQYQFGLGVYTGFLMKQKNVTKGINGLFDITEDNTDSYTNIDFGLSGSFSMYIPIQQSIAIKVGLDDYLGLVNTSDVPVVDDGTIKHNSFGLTLGLNFKLK